MADREKSLSTEEVAVHLKNVSLRYAKQGPDVLQDITLDVQKDTICGVLERNAAGKTSLLSVIGALHRPTQGEVCVFGEDPYENPRLAALISFTFNREYKSYFGLRFTVADLLKLSEGIRPEWSQVTAERMLERFDLEKNVRVNQLSTGQRAALNCTIGIACRTALSIFDEAYLGLDPIYREVFFEELIRDYIDHPRTILFSTHYIIEMEKLFSKVMIIDNGRIVAYGDSDELRQKGGSIDELFRHIVKAEVSTNG